MVPMPGFSCLRTFLQLLAATALTAVATAQSVVSYHGVSSATHQANFNSLSLQGYRIQSLSVAGTLSAPTYSAVWEQVGGPPWLASHDMSATQYTTFRNNCILQGYRAKLITAAGTTALNRVFAAVFVNDGATVVDSTSYSESSFLDTSPVQNPTCTVQRNSGNILVSADIYGDASTGFGPFVCAVFEPNTNNTAWGCQVDATASEFSETRTAHGTSGSRLASLGMSDTQRYISVWHDDRVGNETIAVNQTGTGWQTLYNAVTATQYHRIIASGGSGAALRFAGSFAQYRNPMVRNTATTGVFRLQFAAFDTHLRNVLVDNGARAGALAIAKDGKLVYARGFTRAESGYPVTQPDDVFRLASLTKVFNAVATHEADELGHFSMTDGPQAILGLSAAVNGFDNIQIRHILEYVSGIRETYSATSIAADKNVPLPISLLTGTDWLDEQALRYQPPSIFGPTSSSFSSYSNAAWLLTGECIRARSGQSFVSFLQNRVFTPLSITRAKVAASSQAQLGANDVIPHPWVLSTPVTELDNSGTRVSEEYYEDLNFKRTSGGMACSAIDYVRFLSGVFDLRGADAIVLQDAKQDYALEPHTFIDFEDSQPSNLCRAGMSWHTRTGNVTAYSKGGSLGSASTYASWRTDGVSFAIFVNVGSASLDSGSLHTMLDGFTNWPNVDEFPSYGMPSFPRRALIESVAPASLANVTSSWFTVTGKRMDTVTQVDFGNIPITSTSPSTWADGWFDVISPTELRVYPPQGRTPATYALRLVNGAGNSNTENVSLTFGTAFRLVAPTTVGNQPWAIVVGRGTLSGLSLQSSFVILCLSSSNQPSSAPGVVDLGLGNQFTDLFTTGAVPFNLFTSAVRFDLPPMPTGTMYFEAVGLDFAAPSLFPLSTTNTAAVTRP